MTTREPRVLDRQRFALADRISRRLVGRRTADDATREAVATLTAAADPDRADRLRPRPGEPAVLVERLAMWALARVDDDAVRRADAVLDAELAACADAADLRPA